MTKSPNALELLRKDHRNVLALLRRFDKSDDDREQRNLCSEIIAELDTHTMLEEDCFYPYVREATDRVDLIEEATIEHGTAKALMRELGQEQPDPARFHALVKVLGDYVTLHVREEEERIFPVVEKLGIDLEALGQELAERKNGAPAHAKLGAAQRGGESQPDARRSGARSGEETRDDDAFVREHGDELSRSAQHAKWIHSIDEHEEHQGQTLATRNPEVIRQWADERKAQPATTPGGDAENPRVLRFDFPGFDKELQPVSWNAWLRTFDERELVFLYQEHLKAGRPSNFFRLDSPHREEG